ncbi:MupA/Atu3671 family FMN-dependent luciferase-like monooxygenase [Mesorhizobium sp. NPDC059054]|uniref:MupA/Atu3671 family FMN-dependent luciferase-like monooxygenase n=1 Tax=Mesorhizobium sp. NPDC059054 TaxID=3346711 RepID=UPI0036B2797B
MKFSLIFFSNSYPQEAGGAYAVISEMARYGDRHGFEAVWIPERHFHTMGGIYPNPAVVAAYLASITSNIRLRAGSAVASLHHPASVVESWSVVDNLSNGRVDLALASGWNVNDFVLAPSAYANLRDIWFERIDEIRALWRGQPVSYPNGAGKPTPITTYPRPIQKEPNLWLTATKQPETFRRAGELGMNVLTMLAGISLEQLAQKTALYREGRERAGLDPDTGTVTLMLHTFVHEDIDTVHRAVRGPFLDYIKTSLMSHLQGGAVDVGRQLSAEEVDQMAEYSFERYFSTAALFGTVAETRKFALAAREAGVGEIACLLDYGPSVADMRANLPFLAELKHSLEAVEA